jgi:hypothetical protein
MTPSFRATSSRSVAFACVSLVILMSGVNAFGQGATGTILGSVKDPSGAVLPGVAVTATNTATNAARSTVTNDSGDFVVPLLPVGQYSIKAELTGFKSSVVSGIDLHVDQKARVDVTLQVGEIRDQVTVSGEAPVVQTDSGSVGKVIENQAIVRLPLNGRNFMQLTMLAPGFVSPPGDLRSSYQGIAPTANGVRSENNNYLLDGTSNTEHWNTNVVTVPPLDSLVQFKLQTANYSAEYGQGGGAIVNIVTKSGTNKFRGAVWEFHRNDNLDARNFFATTKPEFKRNQFGGVLGGPVVRDKTFFFVSYEGLRQGKGITLTRLVPTPEEARGVFTNSVNPKPRDPLTGLAFPNDTIPANRIDPISQRFITKFFVTPNNLSDPRRNYIVSPTGLLDQDNFGTRVDHHLRANDTLFIRYNRNKQSTLTPNGWPGCCDGFQDLTGHQGAIQETHVFSPKAINEFKFAANRVHKSFYDSTQGQDITGQLGLTGIAPGDESLQMVGISVAGYNVATVGQRFNEVRLNTFVWSDNFSYVRGNHTLKMGVEFTRFQFNDLFPPANPISVTFSNIFTGNGLADFLLGRLATFSLGFRQPFINNRITNGEAYLQDDWHVTSRFTLNLGLRYTTQWPTTERYNRQTGLNLTTGASKIPKEADIGNFKGKVERIDRNTLFDQDQKLAPRFGFAFRPFNSNRTVLRGGYGVFTALEQGNSTRQPSTNPPFRLIYSQTDNTNGFGWNTGRPTPDQVYAGFATGFSAQFIDESWRNGYVQNWNLTVEQEVLSNTALSFAYVGSKGTHLSRLLPLNQPPPGQGAIQARRPYPDFSGITYIQNASNSTYHSFQVTAEKRYSAGLSFLTSYTFSKALGDASTLNQNAIQDPRCDRCEKGRLDFDVRHRFIGSYGYDLPFGPGRRFLNGGGAAAALFAGWGLSGITTVQSGFPLTITTRDNANTGGRNLADRVAGVDPNPSDRTINAWIPRAAFTDARQFTFGNSGRGIVDSPGLVLFDFAVIREFRIRETKKLAFHADFFNVFNHANFGFPVTNLTAGNFGVISSAAEPRDIQLGLKFIF